MSQTKQPKRTDDGELVVTMQQPHVVVTEVTTDATGNATTTAERVEERLPGLMDHADYHSGDYEFASREDAIEFLETYAGRADTEIPENPPMCLSSETGASPNH